MSGLGSDRVAAARPENVTSPEGEDVPSERLKLVDDQGSPTSSIGQSLGTNEVHGIDGAGSADRDDRRAAIRTAVGALDDQVDRWFDPYRGRPLVDAAAKVVTGLGDHGLMWALTAAWRGRRPGPERTRAIRALAIAGVESRLVNSTLKGSIGRSRPDPTGLKLTTGGVPVRRPTSSSFPSGHTLAAFCAATVMRRPGDRRGNAFLLTGAALVGLSRLHLRAHHASDVVGGAVIGTALGLVGRRLV